MSNKVFVGNLPWSIRTRELSTFLTELGFSYRSVKVIEDRETGRSRGFAFVEFETSQAAIEAIAELSGTVCEGRSLFANEANDSKPGSSSGGGGRPRGAPRFDSSSFPPDEARRRSKSNKPRRGRDDEPVW
jgi:RNA recognition motif-containing protein